MSIRKPFATLRDVSFFYVIAEPIGGDGSLVQWVSDSLDGCVLQNNGHKIAQLVLSPRLGLIRTFEFDDIPYTTRSIPAKEFRVPEEYRHREREELLARPASIYPARGSHKSRRRHFI